MDPAELKPLENVGLLAVRDAETGEERWIDTGSAVMQAQQRTEIRRRERRIDRSFRRAQLEPLPLSTDGDYLKDLAQKFRGKKR